MGTIETATAIRNILVEWGESTANKLYFSIEKLEIGRSGHLENSIRFKVTDSNGAFAGRIEFLFKDYGRFVDMGVGRGVPIGSLKELGRSRFLNKRVKTGQLKSYRRGGKKWYSKTAYGNISKLHDQLLGYAADVFVNGVKQNIK